MDAQAAVANLREVSKQIESAVLFADGAPLASTVDDQRAGRMAELAERILAAVDEVEGDLPVTQVEAATGEGSVFLVREGDLAIAGTSAPTPLVGLVMYDLRACLRSLVTEKEPA